jgi:hypothetical protein
MNTHMALSIRLSSEWFWTKRTAVWFFTYVSSQWDLQNRLFAELFWGKIAAVWFFSCEFQIALWILICLFKYFCRANDFEQQEQIYGFSPVWILIWLVKFVCRVNDFEEKKQWFLSCVSFQIVHQIRSLWEWFCAKRSVVLLFFGMISHIALKSSL